MKKELRSEYDPQLAAFLAEKRREARKRIVIVVTPANPQMYAALFYPPNKLTMGLPWLEA